MESKAAVGGRGRGWWVEVWWRWIRGNTRTGVNRVQGVRLPVESAASRAFSVRSPRPGGGQYWTSLCKGRPIYMNFFFTFLLSKIVQQMHIKSWAELVSSNSIPEKSEVVPSESTLRFSELSAVPIEASDSRVSSSEARGSRLSISKVSSSLQSGTLSILIHPLSTSVMKLFLENLIFCFLFQAMQHFLKQVLWWCLLLFLQALNLLCQHSLFPLHGCLLMLWDFRQGVCSFLITTFFYHNISHRWEPWTNWRWRRLVAQSL